jgi:hypothetical protein
LKITPITTRIIASLSFFIAFLYAKHPIKIMKQVTAIVPLNAIHSFPGLGITDVEVGTGIENNE